MIKDLSILKTGEISFVADHFPTLKNVTTNNIENGVFNLMFIPFLWNKFKQ